MKLMLLDGNSILNRAFYGVRPLTAPDGTPTNGIFGFLNILQRLVTAEQPDALCVTFDVHAPTFRHRACDFYKAKRKPMPEELAVQMPLLKQVLAHMGITTCELAGWEADDLLGTLSRRGEALGWDCRIVTGDRDSLQLVTEQTHVLLVTSKMGQTSTEEITPEVFRAQYGFEPPQLVDLKAIMGDSSDNIPGVPGVGEKGAMDLLHRYGTLEEIYRDLSALDVKEGVRKKLALGEASARQSYWLATIVTDAPLELELEQTAWTWGKSFRRAELRARLKELGFVKFISAWDLTGEEPAAPQAPVDRGPAAEPCPASRALELTRCAAQLAAMPTEDGLELSDGTSRLLVREAPAPADYRALLQALNEGPAALTVPDGKLWAGLLLDREIEPARLPFDAAVAGYLLDPTSGQYDPERLCTRYGIAGEGSTALLTLTAPLKKELDALGLTELYEQVEQPLDPVLAEMERTGFLVDREALDQFGQMLSARAAQAEQLVYELAGETFNLNSTRQLGHILFEKLALPTGKKTKTGWSTNVEVLERLRDRHPIIEPILEYRQLSKLNSTYAEGLARVIGPDGRIHTSFQNTVTATGRLSSAEPNLQNIPVRTELGAQFRRMFTAAPGCVLVDADCSQIELRLMAHIAGDETMAAAFRSGGDIHRATAAQIFGVSPEDVTHEMRTAAKRINFGILYGMSEFSLSQDLGVSRSEAGAYMQSYFDTYRGVAAYRTEVVERARRDGYAVTLMGRRRPMPELASKNFNQRAFGERVALNMPIQGTAADLIKLAMVRVRARLAEELPEAHLVLQVHDELIVECPAEQAEQTKALLAEEMEGVAALSVPLTVEIGVGETWAEAHG